jgi:acyl carrier protein
MSAVTPTDVRLFLKEYLTPRLAARGRDSEQDLPEDCDLLLTGLVDSLGLLELVTALTEHFGRQIAFEDLDPEQFTVVGPLCRYVAQQMSQE